MLNIVSYKSDDGAQRWSREITRPEKKPRSQPQVDVPPNFLQFDELYRTLAAAYTGAPTCFSTRQWTRKKFLIVSRTLSNLKDYGIEMDLFLRAQFERFKAYPKAIWPSKISSLRAIKTYQMWISKFASEYDARRQFDHADLEEVLLRNHTKYLYYREKIGLSDEIIFKVKAMEFDAFYVLATPSFIDQYQVNPETLKEEHREKLESAKSLLRKNPSVAKDFWELVRKVKCQTVHNSTLSSK